MPAADERDIPLEDLICPFCQKRNTLYLGLGKAECHDCGKEFMAGQTLAEAKKLEDVTDKIKAIQNLLVEKSKKSIKIAVQVQDGCVASVMCKPAHVPLIDLVVFDFDSDDSEESDAVQKKFDEFVEGMEEIA